MAVVACPWCDDGTETVTHLVGDGVPGQNAWIETETITCRGCDGTGEIDLPDEEC